MKDGFKSITIEPFNECIDFPGPINAQKPSNNSRLLKGDVHLELTKAIKVKRATIKFKGSSHVSYQNTLDLVNISSPILPKLKLPLFSSTTLLGPGKVILPWEMEIDNIYPASIKIKRVSIQYKVELNISLGLHRTVKAEYPIVIQRHLLPCLEMAPLVPTKLYTKTISTKFHYEIEAPRIVCIAQETIPFTIKLLAIGSQKQVLSIRTQIIQVELYRCNALPKSDADMTKFKSQLSGQKNAPSAKKGDTNNKYAKYTKRTTPAIVHTLDETQPLSSSQPLLLHHPLSEHLALGLESPLAAIYHQLEIVFQFSAKFEDIRAKVPILVTSAGPSTLHPQQRSEPPIPLPLYPYEKLAVMEPLFVADESRTDGQCRRTPTPTPSSHNSDTTTLATATAPTETETAAAAAALAVTAFNTDEEDVNGILEIMANYSNFAPDQSLRRARSATSLITNDTTQPPSKLPHNRRILDRKRPTDNRTTMEMLSGMWPRPETKVPHQWRRRQSSSSPPRPIKNTRRKWAPPIVTAPLPPPPPTQLGNLAGTRALSDPMDDPLSEQDESESSSSYMDTSFSSTSPSEWSTYEPQSRPNSPSFAPAPGLPPFISLRPQNANPVALLEESFVLSPGSSVSSYHYPTDTPSLSHSDSLQYTQGFTRNGSGGLSLDRLSILSTAHSSILDPDEEMIMAMERQYWQQQQQQQQQQQDPQSLERHYAFAKLPPIPKHERPATLYYADDSSDGDDYTTDMDDDGMTTSSSAQDDESVCVCPKHGIVVTRRS